MSDIDRTRMIPLHIADQAVAACDAEIAKLREENQRLTTLCKQLMAQHSDISCENIMLRKANDQLAEVRELHAGFNRALFNETVTENARLKAEVERLTKAGDAMDAYLKRQDGTTNGMLDCRLQWHAAKETKPHA
jgi:hypothetical protein